MGVLRQLEERLGRWTDQLTARWLGGHPTAPRLASSLLEHLRATPGPDGRPRLLNAFTVRLQPDDLARLGDLGPVTKLLLGRLRQEAEARRLPWHGRPRLSFLADDDEAVGAIRVEVEAVPGAGEAELCAGGQSYRLAAAAVMLGREPGCAVRLDQDGVSRRHARLEAVAEGWRVIDLGSTNGTFVNGRRVSAEALADGDELRCGPVRLQFRER